MARPEFPDPSLPVSNDGLRFSRFSHSEKAEIRRRRKEWLAANKDAAKAAKEKQARTCQICGRKIHASTGVIAHHGYTRPGDGWQTASCFGARYQSFEKSCERLKEWIFICVGTRDSFLHKAEKAARGDLALPVKYSQYDRSTCKRTFHTFWAGDASEYAWAQAVKYYGADRFAISGVLTWEQGCESYAKELRTEAANWEHERQHQAKRLAEWVQTEQ